MHPRRLSYSLWAQPVSQNRGDTRKGGSSMVQVLLAQRYFTNHNFCYNKQISGLWVDFRLLYTSQYLHLRSLGSSHCGAYWQSVLVLYRYYSDSYLLFQVSILQKITINQNGFSAQSFYLACLKSSAERIHLARIGMRTQIAKRRWRLTRRRLPCILFSVPAQWVCLSDGL